MFESAGLGALLGLFFYGGLWWTVLRGLSSSQPALWFLVSMGLRVGVVGLGFCWLSQGDWRRLGLGMLTFQLARLWVDRQVRHAA